MTLSLIRKFEINLLLLVVKLLWYLDLATGQLFPKVVQGFGAAGLAVLSLSFFVFIGYSIKTGYLNKIASGFQATQNYVFLADASSGVLGSKTARRQIPFLVKDEPTPELSAKAFLVVDKKSGKFLAELNSKSHFASASTTKLMTALIASEIYSADDVLTVPDFCTEVESTKADLPAGTSYTFSNLLNVMLVGSAGDAACTIANNKVSLNEFVYLMNQKAFELGMRNTFFTNPIGLDGTNSSHFSTPVDLYKLADAAMNSTLIRQAVKTKELTLKSIGESYIRKIENTNKLLFEMPQSIGIKTGTTTEAGQVLIYEYMDEAKDLVIVIMGSTDRFTDARALLYWTMSTYSWN